MTTGQIVAIVVLVLLVALVVAAVLIFRRRSPSHRRMEAVQHWREAEQRRASAERLEAEARQRAERARAEQAQAEELAQMARHDREVAEKARAQAERLDPEHTQQLAAVDGDRAGRAPRHQRYREPEPIVGGAAEGLLEKRRTHHRPEHGDQRHHAEADRTDPAGIPAQRSAPAEESTRNRRTVGEFLGDKLGGGHHDDHRSDQHHDGRHTAGTHDPAVRHSAGGATATREDSRPSLADRIMGRG